jgi:CBS-domain-containing membrane protein
VVTATPDEPLADLITRIGDRTGDNRAIVINDRGQVIGVISPRDLARAAILAELSTATATTSAGNHGPQRHRDDHPINKDRLLPA